MSAVEAGHASNSVMEQVGPNIIHHVSNSDISHPIIHLPTHVSYTHLTLPTSELV